MAGTGNGSSEVSAMKYAGMPFGMWVLFAGSFQKQLTAVLGYDAQDVRAACHCVLVADFRHRVGKCEYEKNLKRKPY